MPLFAEEVAEDIGAFQSAFDIYQSRVSLLSGAESSSKDYDEDMIGGVDCPKVSKKALKLRVKRKRKRIDAVLTNVMGGNIVETRANAKTIPLEELRTQQELLHVE